MSHGLLVLLFTQLLDLLDGSTDGFGDGFGEGLGRWEEGRGGGGLAAGGKGGE